MAKIGRGYKKVSDEEIIKSYKKLGNIWKTGKVVGLCGQSVHERLKKLGVQLKLKPFSSAEKDRLQNEYSNYRDSGKLQVLADKMGRTKHFLCRQAKKIRLTDPSKPYKISKSKNRNHKKENHPNWKGGVTENRIAIYDTYKKQLGYVEKIRRNPNDKNVLQVRCAYCGKWYSPTLDEVSSRVQSLKHNKDTRIYCSVGCKQACPIYGKIKYPEGFRKGTSREVVAELRQIVFNRDDYECQKCGSIESLHCHHIKGYTQNKMLSNDPDNCITLCKKCHKEIHKLPGCGYNDLKCTDNPRTEIIIEGQDIT